MDRLQSLIIIVWTFLSESKLTCLYQSLLMHYSNNKCTVVHVRLTWAQVHHICKYIRNWHMRTQTERLHCWAVFFTNTKVAKHKTREKMHWKFNSSRFLSTVSSPPFQTGPVTKFWHCIHIVWSMWQLITGLDSWQRNKTSMQREPFIATNNMTTSRAGRIACLCRVRL